MMLKKVALQAAIPGSSLTSDVSKWPWGRPSRMNNPDEVLDKAVQRLEDPIVRDKLLALLAAGISVQVIVRAINLEAFQQGEYSVDIATMIAPPLALAIADIAEEANIPYQFFANPEKAIPRKMDDKTFLQMIAMNNPDMFRSMKEELNRLIREGRISREEVEQMKQKSFIGSGEE